MHRAFTLIELLIVVAIVAILAAIAVPNFLEAQVRAKVARAQNDLRTLVTALEHYRVDNRNYPYIQHSRADQTIEWQAPYGYPPGFGAGGPGGLTTPIAYLTTALRDPFELETEFGSPAGPYGRAQLYFERIGWGFDESGNRWDADGTGVRGMRVPLDGLGTLTGTAPDAMTTNPAHAAVNYVVFSVGPNKSHRVTNPDGTILVRSRLSVLNRYDPTNGTISEGCVLRYANGQTFP